jgi:hypothetical protein
VNKKRQVSYFQLGSVSPTSFKINPIASGIVLISTDKDGVLTEKIYDNHKLIMYSIDKKHKIDKLIQILEEVKDFDIAIFLKYPSRLKNKIKSIIDTYPIVKGIQETD